MKRKLHRKVFPKAREYRRAQLAIGKKKQTNPSAEKIMIICKVLDVTPEWLLSGIKADGKRGNPIEWYAIDRNSEIGELIDIYNELSNNNRMRLMAYLEALKEK